MGFFFLIVKKCSGSEKLRNTEIDVYSSQCVGVLDSYSSAPYVLRQTGS